MLVVVVDGRTNGGYCGRETVHFLIFVYRGTEFLLDVADTVRDSVSSFYIAWQDGLNRKETGGTNKSAGRATRMLVGLFGYLRWEFVLRRLTGLSAMVEKLEIRGGN